VADRSQRLRLAVDEAVRGTSGAEEAS
jgi:hypothetical protein